MIAEAEAPVRVQERELQSPFRQHPIYGCVFAPLGMFGTLYAVETEAEFCRLNKKFPHTYWFNHCGTFNVTFILPWLLGKFFHWNLFEKCIASTVILVLLYLPYVVKIRTEARCLPVVQSRLPFLMAARHYAGEQSRETLWFFSITLSLCSWLLWMLSRGVYGDQRLILCLLLFVSIVFTLWHSLLIFVRESTMTRRRGTE